ncbi:SulP family inorganic anion transporter [Nesterenkonia flava]|uniref:SulP family inorganic anion transporter n=1 Tax=Nesterenkonia flava TaxID=469799 RepID=A0ABU1FR93_9MICC|nr:SulP family inorganic anion transporter [Nesterenkonia flava]MDR5710696.1 SulP family inorganic anion transporter [Nesterenkonia flava]
MPQAASTDSPSPLQRQSVWHTLRSPRLLKIEVLAGLVTALALIPESMAFAIIAGVDPRVGLFASVVMAMSIAVVGGRPAMVSGGAGATALVIAPVMASHGLDYFIATVLMAGVLQVVLALAGVARLMRFIPRSVMVGFVNGLAILIFSSQFPELVGVPWLVYPLVALGLLVVFVLPRLTQAVPAPFISIVLLTAVTACFALAVPTVADRGELPTSLPELFIPDVPLTWGTLQVIAPYALAMACVGLLESLMTAKLVDDITDTGSDKTRESWGQGVANMLSSLTGGMGGCAMIGQTMINVKAAGARTRISTFCAGLFILILVASLGEVVGMIPMAALVAIMVFVAFITFDWHSIAPETLKAMPKSETAVMLLTTVTTVVTHNLAIGVGVGVLSAALLFAHRVSRFAAVTRELITAERDRQRVHYSVQGQLFFASSNDLYYQFSYADDPQEVVIDFSAAHLWDASTVAALDSVVRKYHDYGKSVQITGLNRASEAMLSRLTGKLT